MHISKQWVDLEDACVEKALAYNLDGGKECLPCEEVMAHKTAVYSGKMREP
jgi:hypothetical protein